MTIAEVSCEESLQTIDVLLVDDHPPFRIGMRTLLEQDRLLRVVGDVGMGRQAISIVESSRPDVVVLDCRLPDMTGASVCAEILALDPACAVLGLSAYDDVSYVDGLLTAGAKGYILKNEAPSTIVRAVHAVAEGHSYLSTEIAQQIARFGDRKNRAHLLPTGREMDVLHLLARGMTNSEMAAFLQVAEPTVAFHLENLMNKLNTSNRTETVIAAVRNGYITLREGDS